jgi:hypothetical protein
MGDIKRYIVCFIKGHKLSRGPLKKEYKEEQCERCGYRFYIGKDSKGNIYHEWTLIDPTEEDRPMPPLSITPEDMREKWIDIDDAWEE